MRIRYIRLLGPPTCEPLLSFLSLVPAKRSTGEIARNSTAEFEAGCEVRDALKEQESKRGTENRKAGVALFGADSCTNINKLLVLVVLHL